MPPVARRLSLVVRERKALRIVAPFAAMQAAIESRLVAREVGMKAEAERHRGVAPIGDLEAHGQAAVVQCQSLLSSVGPRPSAGLVEMLHHDLAGLVADHGPGREPAEAVQRMRMIRAREVRPQPHLPARHGEPAMGDAVREGHQRKAGGVENRRPGGGTQYGPPPSQTAGSIRRRSGRRPADSRPPRFP